MRTIYWPASTELAETMCGASIDGDVAGAAAIDNIATSAMGSALPTIARLPSEVLKDFDDPAIADREL
jgi:hypothetical protein